MGLFLNAAIRTIRSKHDTLFIFSIFLMFGYIDLKINDLKFFQIESKSLFDKMLLKSFVVDFYKYVFVLTVIFLKPPTSEIWTSAQLDRSPAFWPASFLSFGLRGPFPPGFCLLRRP